MSALLIFAGILLIGFFLTKFDATTTRKKKLDRLKAAFGKKTTPGKNDFEDISVYDDLIKDTSDLQRIDDVTWNDLEMDLVFSRINCTKSYIGEQVLYHRLHTLRFDYEHSASRHPASNTVSENHDFPSEAAHSGTVSEKRISLFLNQEPQRVLLEYELLKIGKSHEDYYLPLFLFNADGLSVEKVWIYHVLQLILFGSFLGACLFEKPLFFLLVIVTACVNLMIYTLSKEKYEAYLSSLSSLKYMISFVEKIVNDDAICMQLEAGTLKPAVQKLHKLTHSIGKMQSKKSGVFTGDIVGLLWDYIVGITLWDFTVFRRITKQIAGKMDLLLLIYEYIGQLDMEIAIASFRKSLPFYCEPAPLKVISTLQLYHPLLDAPISNDLMLDSNCIITGSNASGKSTFIKAIAINAILAQTIHTCTAKTFSLPCINVMTSMTVRDDVLAGESYYVRELQHLKRIIDAVNEISNGVPTLCIVDEILRGTNATERLAASKAILHYLQSKNCRLIVATHDMDLAEALRNDYHCFYFCNYIENKNIIFDYKLHEGFRESKNALKLLEYLDFPAEIIDSAKNT